MEEEKSDMSKECGFKYDEYWLAADHLNMPQEEWQKWYDEHCGKCEYMGEVCMYDKR